MKELNKYSKPFLHGLSWLNCLHSIVLYQSCIVITVAFVDR